MTIGISAIGRSLARFLADQRGAAGAEFAIMLPLPLAITLLAAEYGNGLMTREALDSALRDATRLLSRAPLAEEDGRPAFHAHFLSEAARMVAERTGRGPEEIRFEARIVPVEGGGAYRTEMLVVETEAALEADLALLAFLSRQIERAAGEGSAVSEALTMHGYDSARYVGETPIGAEGCPASARAVADCGGV